jgi:hypothetical protein
MTPEEKIALLELHGASSVVADTFGGQFCIGKVVVIWYKYLGRWSIYPQEKDDIMSSHKCATLSSLPINKLTPEQIQELIS